MTKATGESEAYQLHSISEDKSADPGHANSSGILFLFFYISLHELLGFLLVSTTSVNG